MTSDNDRGFIDPKQENHIFIKEMLESIFLKSDIESCIVTIIDNVFHSASYLFLGAWIAMPSTSANASYITSENVG